MKSVYDFKIKGSRLKCSGYRIHTKAMKRLNNVRREASTHFRIKNKECLKAKIDELETHSKIEISETGIPQSMILNRVTSLNK